MSDNNYQNNYSYDSSVMTVGQWIVTMLLLAIPVVNIVLLFVWAFSGNTNLNKRNYCRATLIIGAVAIVLSLIIGILTGIFAS